MLLNNMPEQIFLFSGMMQHDADVKAIMDFERMVWQLNTLVWYSTDNGPDIPAGLMGVPPFREKNDTYEGGRSG
jgi:arylsulfatase A-like enzyme